MRIVVLNETSAADRNADILSALEGRGHFIINAGMQQSGTQPELTYIHTGLLAALFLNLGAADLVVGGCGTGQGFLISVMQYPNITCGHIVTPLDVWLFTQINGGNCISLMLNQGYGWASNVNLKIIFDALFSVESGIGYPTHRQQSQRQSQAILSAISGSSHLAMADILPRLPGDIVLQALNYPGIFDALQVDALPGSPLKNIILQWR